MSEAFVAVGKLGTDGERQLAQRRAVCRGRDGPREVRLRGLWLQAGVNHAERDKRSPNALQEQGEMLLVSVRGHGQHGTTTDGRGIGRE